MKRGLELAVPGRRITVVLTVAIFGSLLAFASPVSNALTTPSNDNFADAQALTGSLPIHVTGTNVGATVEADEPGPANITGASVWYTFEPSATGDYKVELCASDFATLLMVFRGSSLVDLKRVDMDRFGCHTDQSRLYFPGLAGKTYRIAVYGMHGDTDPPDTGAIDLVVDRFTLFPLTYVDDVFTPEGNSATHPSKMIFTVSRAKATSQSVKLEFATEHGTEVYGGAFATDDVDYASKTGPVTIPAGERKATFAIKILSDKTVEPDETFRLRLTRKSDDETVDVSYGTMLNDD